MFGNPVFVAIKDQHQRAAFLRQDDVAEFIERHRNDAANLIVAQDALDSKALLNLKAFGLLGLLLGNNVLVAVPRHRVAKDSELGRRLPESVVEQHGLPHRCVFRAGSPRRVAAKGKPLVLVVWSDRHASCECRSIAMGVDDTDCDHIATDFKEVGNVNLLHLPSRRTLPNLLAVDKDLEAIVRRDFNLSFRRHAKVDWLAKQAGFAFRNWSLQRTARRPNPFSFFSVCGRGDEGRCGQYGRNNAAQNRA